MRLILIFLLFSASLSAAPPPDDYRLEKVVTLSRHGIRPPTVSNRHEIERATGQRWPDWSTPDGELTANGRHNIMLKAQAEAQYYRSRGLFSHPCPAPGEVYVRASPLQRTIATARTILTATFPDCQVAVHYQHNDQPDPLLQPEKLPFSRPDPQRYHAALTAASQDLSQRQQRLAPVLSQLRHALCADPEHCRLFDARWQPRQSRSGGWYIQGLSTLAAITETLRMAWSENLPDAQLPSGYRWREEQLQQLLPLLTISYDLSNDLPLLAQRRGSLLLSTMLDAVNAPADAPSPGTRWLLLVAHDTNIAAVRTLMGFQWQLPGYNHGNIPPGGSLVLERWRHRASGERYLRLYFQAQSLAQLHNRQPPDSTHPLLRQQWRQPGCKETRAGVLCPFQAAIDILSTHIDRGALMKVEWR